MKAGQNLILAVCQFAFLTWGVVVNSPKWIFKFRDLPPLPISQPGIEMSNSPSQLKHHNPYNQTEKKMFRPRPRPLALALAPLLPPRPLPRLRPLLSLSLRRAAAVRDVPAGSCAAVALSLGDNKAGAESAIAHTAARAGQSRARSVRAVDVSSVRASAAWTSANQ